MNLKNLKLNRKLLKKNKVGLVIIFGSRVFGRAHPGSDIDIGIVFEDEKIKAKNPLEIYGDLYKIFSKAFKTANPDIVYLREAPLSLQFKAIDEGVVIYETSVKFFADYKEEVMIKYFDFKFTENYFNRVFLNQEKRYDKVCSIGYKQN
ncbi:nucleotidyltransferase domain-containing protein [Patescibacteria group bacterium]|nr:nucleotidyltransferase domain-containing protein [Patescibacteria group bacterium]MBU3999554.1 nucleotidyltransferase domain-containing protein [Patescibacteria group bacterium]MBU4056898.1 nucleotidyltransferase domain-containing protein [Patescibacteria group bacterium]MBU4368576.1 nucleotidyltransferase domain-containing protein [Patescibacteria group bacterium]